MEQTSDEAWYKAAFGMRDDGAMQAIRIRAEDLLQEGLVREYWNGVSKARTAETDPREDAYTDGSA